MNRKFNIFINIFFLYNILFLGLLPLLSITRGLGIFQPAYLLYFLNPFIVIIAFVYTYKKIKYTSKLNIYIIITLTLSIVLGLKNNFHIDNTKSYLSHLFQIISFFVTF
jgi:hypothetical protein